MVSGSLNLLEPSGPHRVCNKAALLRGTWLHAESDRNCIAPRKGPLSVTLLGIVCTTKQRVVGVVCYKQVTEQESVLWRILVVAATLYKVGTHRVIPVEVMKHCVELRVRIGFKCHTADVLRR
jgi:hypothetical protein